MYSFLLSWTKSIHAISVTSLFKAAIDELFDTWGHAAYTGALTYFVFSSALVFLQYAYDGRMLYLPLFSIHLG